jgi:hypothetical protein
MVNRLDGLNRDLKTALHFGDSTTKHQELANEYYLKRDEFYNFVDRLEIRELANNFHSDEFLKYDVDSLCGFGEEIQFSDPDLQILWNILEPIKYENGDWNNQHIGINIELISIQIDAIKTNDPFTKETLKLIQAMINNDTYISYKNLIELKSVVLEISDNIKAQRPVVVHDNIYKKVQDLFEQFKVRNPKLASNF